MCLELLWYSQQLPALADMVLDMLLGTSVILGREKAACQKGISIA